MAGASNTQSHWCWLRPGSWLCRFMMKPEKYTRTHTETPNHPKTPSSLVLLLPPTVCLPLQSASLRGVRWCGHWPADQRPGARLPPAGGHAWQAGGHDGEGQDWPGLLQVRPSFLRSSSVKRLAGFGLFLLLEKKSNLFNFMHKSVHLQYNANHFHSYP